MRVNGAMLGQQIIPQLGQQGAAGKHSPTAAENGFDSGLGARVQPKPIQLARFEYRVGGAVHFIRTGDVAMTGRHRPGLITRPPIEGALHHPAEFPGLGMAMRAESAFSGTAWTRPPEVGQTRYEYCRAVILTIASHMRNPPL